MVLTYFDRPISQEEISRQIKHIAGAGTPARNVTLLAVSGIQIRYAEEGQFEDVVQALTDGKIPIVFVRTGELPYWDEDTAHALTVIGLDENMIYVHDPAFEGAPISIPLGDFLLA